MGNTKLLLNPKFFFLCFGLTCALAQVIFIYNQISFVIFLFLIPPNILPLFFIHRTYKSNDFFDVNITHFFPKAKKEVFVSGTTISSNDSKSKQEDKFFQTISLNYTIQRYILAAFLYGYAIAMAPMLKIEISPIKLIALATLWTSVVFAGQVGHLIISLFLSLILVTFSWDQQFPLTIGYLLAFLLCLSLFGKMKLWSTLQTLFKEKSVELMQNFSIKDYWEVILIGFTCILILNHLIPKDPLWKILTRFSRSTAETISSKLPRQSSPKKTATELNSLPKNIRKKIKMDLDDLQGQLDSLSRLMEGFSTAVDHLPKIASDIDFDREINAFNSDLNARKEDIKNLHWQLANDSISLKELSKSMQKLKVKTKDFRVRSEKKLTQMDLVMQKQQDQIHKNVNREWPEQFEQLSSDQLALLAQDFEEYAKTKTNIPPEEVANIKKLFKSQDMDKLSQNPLIKSFTQERPQAKSDIQRDSQRKLAHTQTKIDALKKEFNELKLKEALQTEMPSSEQQKIRATPEIKTATMATNERSRWKRLLIFLKKHQNNILFYSCCLIFAWFIGQFFKKNKGAIRQIEMDQDKLNSLRKELKKLKWMKLTPREEVLKSYNLFYRAVKEISFGEKEPPPPTQVYLHMKRRHPHLAESLLQLTEIFSHTYYGQKEVERGDLKIFRHHRKPLFKFFKLV